ncbi:hypothetical protein ACJEQ9_32675, partial [Klebsiella pneumoniae]
DVQKSGNRIKSKTPPASPYAATIGDKAAALGLQLSAKGYKASGRNAIPRIERTVFCTAFQILLRPEPVWPE